MTRIDYANDTSEVWFYDADTHTDAYNKSLAIVENARGNGKDIVGVRVELGVSARRRKRIRAKQAKRARKRNR